MVTRPKYFLDCGSNNGCSVRRFQRLYRDWDTFTIHSFEPNPVFRSCFNDLKDRIVFHEVAVWVRDDTVPFFLSGKPKQYGSSLIKTKLTGKLDLMNPVQVVAVDFDRWIKANIPSDAFVILKLDIEGAEYDVLRHMISGGTIDYVARLYIDFHYEKIGLDVSEHNHLVQEIESRDIEILPWDATNEP
jgi:FkbM family methyltransferase